ncbi:MAG TPA: GNAT family N-acetyltransferase [Gaiellaceae bacterium]
MELPVVLCADAVAAWHSAWLRALGLRSERDSEAWRALEVPPHIYFAGITLRPDTPVESVAGVPGSICDAWQTLDLAPMGFRVWRREPWFHRPSAPLPEAAPLPELEIVPVTTDIEVEEFEAVSVRGFGNEQATIEPGTFHPATILEDSAMKMFVGRVDGRPVAAAMGYRTDAAVGVFGVTTIASARRRGYGAAVTREAMLTETGLPSVLAPSEEGERMYERLGFRRVGELSIWVKEGPGP